MHHPFNCSKSWALFLNIISDIEPDEIIINGDFEDFFAVNMYGPKHPDIVHTLETEIASVNLALDQIQESSPKSKIIYGFGNHAVRLERFVLDKVPLFYNFFNLKDMYMLEQRAIESFAYQDIWRVGKTELRLMHSPPSYGEVGSRTSLLKKPNSSWIFSCTHRVQMSSITDTNGKVHRCWFNGHMASTNETQEHKRVFSYAKGHENWQKCFGFGFHDGEFFDYQQSLILESEGKTAAMVFGNYYEV